MAETTVNTLNLTIAPPSTIAGACRGSFTAPRAKLEFAAARGDSIELLRVEPAGQLVTVVATTPLFATLRRFATLPGVDGRKDMLAVTTDSGSLVLLDFDLNSLSWVRRDLMPFGKSGVRRAVPGHHLAVDPNSRAVMIAAAEKQKFVIPINQPMPSDDPAEELFPTIGSPEEAHASGSVCIACVAVDTDRTTPFFACLEHVVTAGRPERQVVLYELGSMRQVVRQLTAPVPLDSYRLLAFPSTSLRPTGSILVFGDYDVTAIHFDPRASEHHTSAANSMTFQQSICSIPRRLEYPAVDQLLTIADASIKTASKTSASCFVLVQSEVGDLYKLEMRDTADGVVIGCRYFDTIAPASALVLLSSKGCGYIFAAGDSGDHELLQICGDGLPDDSYIEKRRRIKRADAVSTVGFFRRNAGLRQLRRRDVIRNNAPVVGGAVSKEADMIVLGTGRADSSSVCAFRRGHSATLDFLQSISRSPAVGGFTSLACVGDVALLSDEVSTTAFRADPDPPYALQPDEMTGAHAQAPTVAAGVMDIGWMQVHRGGLRHVAPTGQVEWTHPYSKQVSAAAVSRRQVVVGYHGGGLDYFELDASAGAVDVRASSDSFDEASSIAIAPCDPTTMSRFAGVATAETFTMVSIDPLKNPLAPVCRRLKLTDRLTSASLVTLEDGEMYAVVGLQSGGYVRLRFDPQTSAVALELVSPAIGSGPCRALAQGDPLVPYRLLTCGGRMFRFSLANGQPAMIPVEALPDMAAIDAAAEMAPPQEDMSRVVVGVQANRLAQFRVADEPVHVTRVAMPAPRGGNPRRVVLHPSRQIAAVLECANRALTPDEAAARDTAETCPTPGAKGFFTWRIRTVGIETSTVRAEYPSAGAERLAPAGDYDLAMDGEPLGHRSEAAVSLTLCRFADKEAPMLVVGVVPSYQACPPSWSGAARPELHCVRWEAEGQLKPCHATPIDDVPLAMAEFAGGLLVGAGCALQFFTHGKVAEKLLRKSSAKVVPNRIVSIAARGSFIAVCDSSESVFFVRANIQADEPFVTSAPVFAVFADEWVPRHVLQCCFVDDRTVAVSDRFGTLTLLRLPSAVVTASDDVLDAAVEANRCDAPEDVEQVSDLNGAPHKALPVASFYLGAPATVLSCAEESIIYGLTNGAVGALLPLSSVDAVLLRALEERLQMAVIPTCGREHRAYRGAYAPVRGVIDGDFLHHARKAADPEDALAAFEAAERQAQEFLKHRGGEQSATARPLESLLADLRARVKL